MSTPPLRCALVTAPISLCAKRRGASCISVGKSPCVKQCGSAQNPAPDPRDPDVRLPPLVTTARTAVPQLADAGRSPKRAQSRAPRYTVGISRHRAALIAGDGLATRISAADPARWWKSSATFSRRSASRWHFHRHLKGTQLQLFAYHPVMDGTSNPTNVRKRAAGRTLRFTLLVFLITLGTGTLVVLSNRAQLVNGARPVQHPLSLPLPIAVTLVI